ncbi:MAG: hypothetical protein EOO90_12755 [Pedobacter sp.]|nr:MAG: hypothetical protein EOO90_12755 [Pedobacter sp.]
MKKLILSIIFSLSTLCAFSQVTFSPASFTAEEEVTITLDVSGTPLAGIDDIYIWIFSNDGVGGGKDGLVNGQWGSSSESAKFTKIGTNKFTYKFTGTTIFGQSPAELINFGFLAKTKDGSRQSQDFKPYKFDPLIFMPSQFRVFPAKLDQTDMATVYFHQDLAAEQSLQRLFDVKVTITFYDAGGNEFAKKMDIVAKKESDKLYSYSFIPEKLITLPAGTTLSKFSYQFSGNLKNASGGNVATSGPVVEMAYIIFN